MSNPISSISSLTAETTTGGSQLVLNWITVDDYITVTNIQSMFVYVDDRNSSDGQIMVFPVVPTIDPSTNLLIKTFTVNGLENGVEYMCGIEITVKDGTDISVYSKSTTGTPSTVPTQPQIIVTPNTDKGFEVQILDMFGNLPTKNSDFDGFSEILGAYVIFSDGTSIRTEFFTNDASNVLYIGKLLLELPKGTYEVALSTLNKNGRSLISPTFEFTVSSTVSPVPVVRIVEQMAIDPFAATNQAYSTDSKILLTWNDPAFLGNPPLNQYIIQRVDASGNLTELSKSSKSTFLNTLSYVTDSLYSFVYTVPPEDLGKIFSYNILGENLNGTSADSRFLDGNLTKVTKIRSVKFPSVTSFETLPSDKQSKITTVMAGGFEPSINFTVDASYSALILGSGLESYTSTGLNPITLRNLLNNTAYTVRVRGVMESPNVPGKFYTSAYSTPHTTTPFANIPPVRSLSAKAVDASNNPLDSKIELSWYNPLTTGFTGMIYEVYRKFAGSPDASYNFVDSASVVNSQPVSLMRTGLTNGVSYTYKVVTSVFNTELGVTVTSVNSHVNIMPFATPPKALNVALSYINSTTDLSYSFIDISTNTWGPPILGHRYTLYNMNNGGKVLEKTFVQADGSYNTIRRGTLSGLFGQALSAGTKYILDVESYVVVNEVKYYSVKYDVMNDLTSLSFTWTKPTGIQGTTIVNVDPSGNPLSNNDSGVLKLDWSYPFSQDASNMSFHVFRAPSAQQAGVMMTPPNVNLEDLTSSISGLSFNSSTYYVLSYLGASDGVSPIVSDRATAYEVEGTPIKEPLDVPSVQVSVPASGSIDFSFNQFALTVTSNGSGMPNNSLRYIADLIDLSGNIVVATKEITSPSAGGQSVGGNSSITGSFTGLTDGYKYKVSVTTGVVNSMTGLIVNNKTPVPSETISPYDTPVNVTKFQISPSEQSIVVKWETVLAPPSGLIFDKYIIESKLVSAPNASYLPVTELAIQTNSVYVITVNNDVSLENGTAYNVRMRTVYKDAVPNIKYSSYSDALSTSPISAPNIPTGSSFTMNQNGTGGTLSWNQDQSVVYNVTNYSIVIDGTSGTKFHFERDSIPVSSLTASAGKWSFVISSGLVPGGTYESLIYAEVFTQDTGEYITSLDAAKSPFTAFEAPGVPANVAAKMGDEKITVSWKQPSNTSGQGSLLMYQVFISAGQLDTSGNYLPLTGKILTGKDNTTISEINGFYEIDNISKSPITFAGLDNLTKYIVLIRSQFTVDNSTSVSEYVVLDNLYPRASPVLPTLAALANPNGTITLNMSSDSLFNLESYKVYRQIYDASNTTLPLDALPVLVYSTTYSVDINGNTVPSGSRPITIIDNGSDLYKSDYWQNGNLFKYYVTANYNDKNINPSTGTFNNDVDNSSLATATKFSAPFPCTINGSPTGKPNAVMVKDLSNNLSYYLHKNGSDITSINAIILDASNVPVYSWADGVSSPIDVIVPTKVLNVRTLDTASSQVMLIKIKGPEADTDMMTDALSIAANAGGSSLAVYPEKGAFDAFDL